MWALVEDNVITQIINKPKGMVIGDTRHSRRIFELWSEEELNNVGLYSVVFDNSNKRDENFYSNTNQSFNYADGQVTASYGTATPKQLEDRNATDKDGVELNPIVVIDGLKTEKKRMIKGQASSLLESTDWHNHKALDDDTYTIPENIKTYRANVRSKSNEMETQIDACTNVDELKELYEYTEKADGSKTRPLGEWPTLED